MGNIKVVSAWLKVYALCFIYAITLPVFEIPYITCGCIVYRQWPCAEVEAGNRTVRCTVLWGRIQEARILVGHATLASFLHDTSQVVKQTVGVLYEQGLTTTMRGTPMATVMTK